MSGSLNKIQLIGYLGNDPKLRTANSGQQFATASIATNEQIKKNGEWSSITEWHNLIFGSGVIKTAAHIQKGQHVYIEGKLRSNEWVDKNNIKHRSWSVFVTNIQFLSKSNSNNANTSNSNNVGTTSISNSNIADDNLAAMQGILSNVPVGF
jgi:single-strand DNA-binding protein